MSTNETPMVGDVWEYHYKPTGKLTRHAIAAVIPGGWCKTAEGRSICPTSDKDLWHLVSRADPQPVPAAPDRSKCRDWCGHSYQDAVFPSCECASWDECSHAFFEDSDETPCGWCSPACRDARLPPMAEKAAVNRAFQGPTMRDEATGTRKMSDIFSNMLPAKRMLDNATGASMTSTQWSKEVRKMIHGRELTRAHLARPFNGGLLDEDLMCKDAP